MTIETALEEIAEALNNSSNDDRWSTWDHLTAIAGILSDDERQDDEDPECAYELFAEDGWSLVLSCDRWCVSPPGC